MNIDQLRQNHPELIVRDICNDNFDIEPDEIRTILKNRGVNKWLKNRRLLMQLKTRWLNEIRKFYIGITNTRAITNHKPTRTFAYGRALGRMEAITECRQQLRAVCQSSRDTDFPARIHWPKSCTLPEEFPARPSASWLKQHEKEERNGT
jgi:hypothetical protein